MIVTREQVADAVMALGLQIADEPDLMEVHIRKDGVTFVRAIRGEDGRCRRLADGTWATRSETAEVIL